MLDALVAEARIRWGLDPAAGLQIASPERLTGTPVEPSKPLLLVPLSILRPGPSADVAADQLPGRHASSDSDALTLLRRLYPADHYVGRIGLVDSTTVGELDAAALAGPLYLGPVAPERALASPWALPWIAHRLREPDGCPWDREQTHASLKKHLLEEAYEVYDALDGGATPELAGELGDLYLQIVLHAQLAAEAGAFDLTDVQEGIGRKIVRRHPHVFGDARVATAGDVNRQWEQIKRAEREAAAADSEGHAAPEIASALDGISSSMPALAASQEMQERAAHLGYDWPEIVGILDKIHEELAELDAAATDAERREEVGDLLLVVVNLARRHGVEAEAALRAAADKFRRRFRRVERMARERGVQLRDMSFAELDELWDAAKAEERSASQPTTAEQEIAP
ncbi:MAG TPA: nucleoside triphosphate pyrophosphohydrolase [Candidatus Limnocylindrales bacterium]|nr:nucleoside triphosphate pyrophosphohydrolase [Candidatus Limnocylindrales bacterium]